MILNRQGRQEDDKDDMSYFLHGVLGVLGG
jgi:hypothetical protein